jgi:phosphoglycolate phosphatase
MIKSIIFDFDGTILDSFPVLLNNANKILEELNLEKKDFTPKYVEELRSKSAKQLVQEFKISVFKLPKFVKKVKEFMREELQKTEIFNGMKDLLEKLSKDFLLGILTTNDEKIIWKILEKNGIKSVDFVYSDDSLFGKHKKLRKILSDHNLKKDEVIYVGDEVRDINASKKAGIDFIAVSWGYNSRKALEKETKSIVNSPRDLLKLIQVKEKKLNNKNNLFF